MFIICVSAIYFVIVNFVLCTLPNAIYCRQQTKKKMIWCLIGTKNAHKICLFVKLLLNVFTIVKDVKITNREDYSISYFIADIITSRTVGGGGFKGISDVLLQAWDNSGHIQRCCPELLFTSIMLTFVSHVCHKSPKQCRPYKINGSEKEKINGI